MTGYKRPCDAPVSSSWADHKYRNPPSSEPGTDYGCAYGTPILAAGEGTVVDYSRSTAGGTGRFLTIDLDDGRRVRYLHLSDTWLERGARVSRGWVVAASGASGWGSEWGYGAHVHTTLWAGHYYDFNGNTLDFDTFVGEDPDPEPIPDPIPTAQGGNMLLIKKGTNPDQIILVSVDGGHLRARYLEDPYERAVFLAAGPPLPVSLCDDPTFDGFLSRVGYVYGAPIPLVPVEAEKLPPLPTPPTRTRTRHPLTTEAVLGLNLLGLVALVEVVRFVVEHIVPG